MIHLINTWQNSDIKSQQGHAANNRDLTLETSISGPNQCLVGEGEVTGAGAAAEPLPPLIHAHAWSTHQHYEMEHGVAGEAQGAGSQCWGGER